MTQIKKDSVLLFQGDSVTDCGRNYNDFNDLGKGYPAKIANFLATFYSDLNLKVRNKGISGNRVRDLKARWQSDCLDLNPQIVTILIGINDCWRRFDQNDPTSCEEFESVYREILTQLKSNCDKIILMEPFVLPYPEDRKAWREDLDPKIHAVRRLAGEFGALLIPLDGIFNSEYVKYDREYLSPDGVHPTDAGHSIIAKAWIKSVMGD